MESRIRRESSWNRNEKEVCHRISTLINTIKRVGTRGDLPEMQSAVSMAQKAHVACVTNAERDRTLATAYIATLGRMLQ